MRKIIRTVFNGSVFRALNSYLKYRRTNKGNLRLILSHYSAIAQVEISRSLNYQYDVVIGFMEGWSNHYALSNKVISKRRIVWIHPDYKESYLIPEVDNDILRKSNRIVLVSNQCKHNFDMIFPLYSEKSIVFENIVNRELLLKKSKEYEIDIDVEKLNMCTVCRCDIHVKGLDRILNALKRLKEDGLLSDLVWHLVGGGADAEEIKKKVIEYELSNYIILYGNIENPFPILSRMDFFVLASRYEGKPVSVEEALAMGIPCVVTRYASAHEQIAEGINGMIIENSDSSAYEALKTCITNNEIIKMWKEKMSASQKKNQDIASFYTML